jgi:quercetin dioxygenase-like cupin family protein
VAYIRMPPGQGSPSGVHQHDFEQYYYILQGTLTLEIGGEAPDAPAGSLLSSLVGLPHQNVNRTDCDTIQLMIEARPEPG